MCRAPILLVLLAGVAVGETARGQPQDQNGPVVVGSRRQAWKPVELERLTASLEFLAQYRSDELKDASGTRRERETLFRETLDLSGELYIGHKNLVDVTGTAQLGTDNRTVRSDVVGDSDQWEFVDLYDVRALLFGNSRLPTTVYTRREQNIFDRGFGGRVDQTLMESGIIGQFRSEIAPTTAQYFHRTQDLSDPFERASSTTTQDTFNLQSNIRIAGNQRLDITYTYDDIEEDQSGLPPDRYDRNDANLVHTLAFGPEERRHELRSSLRYYDQSGRFGQTNTRVDELLTLRHTDRLETRYAAVLDEQSRVGVDQRLYRGEASIRHKLYNSLVSSASIGVQQLQAPANFQSDEWFTTGQLDYTKRVPMGLLSASAGASFDAQDNSERGTVLPVTGDARVFNDPQPIVIPRRNIVPGTLELFPSSGFPAYREGIDYTVRYLPDRIEINVPPGSAITDGQTVIANYTLGPEPGNRLETLGTVLSARYTLGEGALRGLSGYATYRTVEQQLDTSDPTLFTLDDSRDLLLGIEFQRYGLDLKYEHERRESEIDPFDADRIQALFFQSLGRESAINLELTHESTYHDMDNNRNEFERAMARLDQRLTNSLVFNVRLEYRNERDDLLGNTEGFEQAIGFTWRRAQTTIYCSFQNSLLNGPNSDRTSQFFQFGLQRNF